MLNGKARPLARLLVVEEQVRLGEESCEAMSNVQTLGGLLCVICTAGAPAIKLCAALVKMPDMGDDARNGNDRSAHRANQRVIDIDINSEWHWFSFTRGARNRRTSY